MPPRAAECILGSMYHQRFHFMRFAKAPPAGLPLQLSGAPARELAPLLAQANLTEADAPHRLREAIGRRYGVQTAQVVLCIGASQANALVALAYLRAGDEVVVEAPTYEALPGVAQWLGAKLVNVARRRERDWELDFGELEKAITARTRLVMLTSPNNPTGRPFGAAEIARLRALSQKTGVAILVDEVYRDDLLEPPAVAVSGKVGTVLTTSSLTKVYGLSSLRLGWVLAPVSVAARLDELTDWLHVVPPVPSVALALAAWPHLEAWREQQRRAIAAAREVLEAWRERSGLLPGKIFDGMAFYLAQLPSADDQGFCELMAQAGVVIPAGSYFGAAGMARIGFGRLDPDRLGVALGAIELMSKTRL